MNKKGKVQANCKMTNEKASFSIHTKKRFDGPLKAVIEAGNNWGVLYDLLEGLEIEVTIAHPLKVRAIADTKIKSDSIDARLLQNHLTCFRKSKIVLRRPRFGFIRT